MLQHSWTHISDAYDSWSHESSRIESAGDQTQVESSQRVNSRISKNMEIFI